MSGPGTQDVTANRSSNGLSRLPTVLFRSVFRDQVGFTLFVVTIWFTLPLVSLGFAINDNMTVANTLATVAGGSLEVKEAVYGQNLDIPGIMESGGRAYGRNYGHVFLALPVLLVLRLAGSVADPFVLIAGFWSLTLYVLVRNAIRFAGYESESVAAGAGTAVVAFLGTVFLGTELNPLWFPYISLSIVSIVAAGFIAVLLYRLLLREYGGAIASSAGFVVTLGTPVVFWAPIPKRHVLVGCLALCSMFLLYSSRRNDTSKTADLHRALSYAPVGMAAWVSAPDGVILGLAVVIADVTTAERTDLRSLSMILVVCVLSFLPFTLTNLAISGSPVTPPRLLSDYGTPPGSVSPSNPNPGAEIVPGWVRSTPFWQIVNQFLTGGVVLLTQPGRVVDVFIRSGYTLPTPEGVIGTSEINLTVIESIPIVAPVAGFAVQMGRRIKRADFSATVEDVFAFTFCTLVVLAYLPRLPLYSTITVRYLVPMYPVLVYATARLPVVRRAVEFRWQWGAWTYAGVVLIGGQLFLAGVILLERGVGEYMQTHAVLNLTIATLLAMWAVAATATTRTETADRYDTVGAVLLGLAAGAGTVLVLLATVAYFRVGKFLLPIVPAI